MNYRILKKIFNGDYPSAAFEYVAQNCKDTEMLKYFKDNPDSVYGAAEFSDFIRAAVKTYTTDEQLNEVTKSYSTELFSFSKIFI